MMTMRTLMIVALAGALLPARAVSAQGGGEAPATDSSAVVAAAARFHEALRSGDSTAALALLADSVIVLESGELETRAEYRAHHLAADIEFSRAVATTRTVRRVTVAGDAAWVVATSMSKGSFRGRPVSSAGVELLVLERGSSGWRIAAIHWSSRRVAAGRPGDSD